MMEMESAFLLQPQPESVEQLLACAFLRFDLTIDSTTVHGECLVSRFALKAGVAIPDIIRTNAASLSLSNTRERLKVQDLLVAIQGDT